MLIMPPGHGQTLSRRRPLAAREKWMLGGVLAGVAVVAIVLVISIGTAAKSSAHGCIYATLPGAVGAQVVNQCGAGARETCQSVHAPGAFTQQAASTVAGECRKAGLPVG
jgi:hypothetical protein